MKNYKKINILLTVAWIVIFATVLIVLFVPKQGESSSKSADQTTENQTTSVVTTSEHIVTAVINESEVDTNIPETTTALDISEVKEYYWYYFNENDKDCYVFKFGDNDRVDLAYMSQDNPSDFVTGYSVYYQQDDTISMKYLPNAFPIKNFTLTVKNNKLYLDDNALIPSDELSVDIFNSYFN